MTRNGYPNPADRVFYNQVDVWNIIQANNSTAPADSGWATDPRGLQGCLQSLANPAGVHWVEYANVTRDAVLFYLLSWMNQRSFPTPVLVNRGGHWVVIVGWTTDVEPLSGTTPVLDEIQFHDPEPPNVGTDTTMTAAQWYGGPWNGDIIYSGTWLGKYVAIVEPPIPKGEVRVKTVRRVDKLIAPAQASRYALRWIKERKLGERPKYALLQHPEVEALEPSWSARKRPAAAPPKSRTTTSCPSACATRSATAAPA